MACWFSHQFVVKRAFVTSQIHQRPGLIGSLADWDQLAVAIYVPMLIHDKCQGSLPILSNSGRRYLSLYAQESVCPVPRSNNDEKTEVILFTPKHRVLQHVRVKVGAFDIRMWHLTFAGALFDQHMIMDKQVHAVCTSAYYHLRNISRIRRYVTKPATNSRSFTSNKTFGLL